ncbi:MAG TPA: class I SAM-dependent methyltransferase [Terriglobia bacterium]|nr:class I SAM-dependent methyltransferase [Terriglobia bacterium]
MSDSDPTVIVELIHAFRYSKIMFAGVSLGIFDLLGSGSREVRDLAQAVRADADALERLLNACVGLRLLRKDNGKYANEPVAQTYLRRDSDSTLAGYILYSDRVLYPLWGKLEDAVREGANRWQQVFGATGSLFDNFFKTDAAQRDFLAGMHGFGLLSSPRVIEAFDLTPYRRLVDLGGATGHLAMAACERYPELRAAVFDLPSVIEVTREYVNKRGFQDRIELIPGDFFKDPLPEADLFSLGRILHDWSEEKIRLLLGKIHARLPRGGALLIAEQLLDETKTAPLNALAQSLNMLVCTDGKERTLSEYTAFLREAGFAEVEGKRTGTPLDAILAVKK